MINSMMLTRTLRLLKNRQMRTRGGAGVVSHAHSQSFSRLLLSEVANDAWRWRHFNASPRFDSAALQHDYYFVIIIVIATMMGVCESSKTVARKCVSFVSWIFIVEYDELDLACISGYKLE